jgi:hypothetical protein
MPLRGKEKEFKFIMGKVLPPHFTQSRRFDPCGTTNRFLSLSGGVAFSLRSNRSTTG